jgi:DNA repair protein RecO (recombination protein O)
LVLRRRKHLEYDVKVLVLLRDYGKVAVMSRGAQRLTSKLKALHEPFTEADFQLFATHDGHNGRLAGGRVIDSNVGLRANMQAFTYACRAAEVVDMLVPYRAPSSDVYDILRRSLAALAHEPHPLPAWISFVVQLLKTLGHGDVSEQLKKLPDEASLDASKALVERELSMVLPRRPKSEIEVA